MSEANCPHCNHEARFHPVDDYTGDRYCSTTLNELPSCGACAEPLRQLERYEPVSDPNPMPRFSWLPWRKRR